MAYVRIPSVLIKWVNHLETLHISGKTVSEVLQNLMLEYPSLKPFLFPSNALSPFINIYVNQKPKDLLSAIDENDELSIIAAFSGG